MGGEGTMAAMNSSLNNNRNLLKQRRNAFNKEKREIPSSSYHKVLRFKLVSKVKPEKIRRRIQQETERMIKALIITAIILVGILFVVRQVYFYSLLNMLQNSNQT